MCFGGGGGSQQTKQPTPGVDYKVPDTTGVAMSPSAGRRASATLASGEGHLDSPSTGKSLLGA